MMRSEHSNDAGTLTPANVDDFKLIHGIGKAIERRLQAAGIHTYSQLAAHTPDQLAGFFSNLAGLTPERIAAMDWIGQARNLASETEYPQPSGTTPASEGRQHYSTFTVELLLDDANNIRRTRVVHVQSGTESAWAGWIPTQLEKLIVGGLEPDATTKAVAQTRESETSQTAQDVPLSGHVRLQDILVIREENRAATRMLRYGQTYSLGAVLDLTKVVIADDLPVEYELTVYARDLSDLQREAIGVGSGTIPKSDHPTIAMQGKSLNRGIYRLEAVVVLSTPADVVPQSSLKTMLEGNLLQIY